MQRIANYGSFLQAHALRQTLCRLGAAVEFVDYHAGRPLDGVERRPAGGLATAWNKAGRILAGGGPLAGRLGCLSHKATFCRRYLPLLGVGRQPNYTPELDCLVIGSDEVFHCTQANPRVGFSPELFGAGQHAGRLISFAASFGSTTLSALERWNKSREVAGYLARFEAISVRDEHSAQMVQALTGRRPQRHLDPALLWGIPGSVAGGLPPCDRPYLLVYAYSGRITPEEAHWIRSYADQRGWQVVALGGMQRCADRFVDCNPFAVRDWFSGAEQVITDTFHGCVFSILTHRPFAAIARPAFGQYGGNREKMTDLLQTLCLTDRLVETISQVSRINGQPIDYDRVDRQLAKARADAQAYLKANLDSTAESAFSALSRKTAGGPP